MIYSIKTQHWSAIKVPYTVDYIGFSRDGKHLYFLMLKGVRDGRGVYRIPIRGGHPELVFDGGAIPFVNLSGESMSLDPTDAPVLTRSVGTCDIYVLHLNH